MQVLLVFWIFMLTNMVSGDSFCFFNFYSFVNQIVMSFNAWVFWTWKLWLTFFYCFLERWFQHSLCSFINYFLSETDLQINLLQSLSLWLFPQSQDFYPTLSAVLLDLFVILLLLILSPWSFSSWIFSLISKLLVGNLEYDFDKGSLLLLLKSCLFTVSAKWIKTYFYLVI